ncbi:MAG: hypothetical protein AMXMBFR33_32320 [Candidatus Xenobia bacterium]
MSTLAMASSSEFTGPVPWLRIVPGGTGPGAMGAMGVTGGPPTIVPSPPQPIQKMARAYSAHFQYLLVLITFGYPPFLWLPPWALKLVNQPVGRSAQRAELPVAPWGR